MKRIIKILVLMTLGGMAYDTLTVACLDDAAFEARIKDMRERRANLRGLTTPRQRNF